MDWSRAKTILILAFLLLNLLLGYQLWYDRADMSGANPEDPEVEMAFEQLLAAKNIKVKVSLPPQTPKMREITVKMSPADGRSRTVQLPSPLTLGLLRDKATYQSTLSKSIPDAESYQLSPVDSGNTQYMLHQMQGDYPMFDVKLELITVGGQITAYRQIHAELVPSGLQDEQKVLSSLTAVNILVEKFLPEGTSIIDVQLGYHGQTFNSEIRYLAPFWRIVTDRGDRYFVHAITGAVE